MNYGDRKGLKRTCQTVTVYYVIVTEHILIKKVGVTGINMKMVLSVQNALGKNNIGEQTNSFILSDFTLFFFINIIVKLLCCVICP